MTGRIFTGPFASGDRGLRLSKAGYDARSEPPDPTKMIFDSAWPALLPIHQAGQTYAGAGAGQVTISFPDLSFLPLFTVALKSDNGNSYVNGPQANWTFDQPLRSQFYAQGSGVPFSYFQAWVTKNTINFYNYRGTLGPGQANDGNWTGMNVLYVIYKLGNNS